MNGTPPQFELARGWRWMLAGLFLLAGLNVRAGDGVWTNNGSGSWSVVANWLASSPADSAGSVAYFTNDITTDPSISLHPTNRIIVYLVFSDGDPSSAGNWTFARVSTQTNSTFILQASTTPTITVSNLGVGKLVNFRFLISGNQGFNKEGDGQLMLGGSST